MPRLQRQNSVLLCTQQKKLLRCVGITWIETNSLVVIKAFKSDSLVPWKMQNRWYNCKKLISYIRCKCSRREGNRVADAMARNGQGLAMHSSQWLSEPPLFYLCYKMAALDCFRFCLHFGLSFPHTGCIWIRFALFFFSFFMYFYILYSVQASPAI